LDIQQLVGVKRGFEDSSIDGKSTAFSTNKVPRFKYGPQIPAFPLTPLPLYLSKREIIVYNEAGHINVAISELYTNILQQKIPRSGARTC
jgi:hypothetical protein